MDHAICRRSRGTGRALLPAALARLATICAFNRMRSLAALLALLLPAAAWAQLVPAPPPVTVPLGNVSGAGALAGLGVGTGLVSSGGYLGVVYGTTAGTAANGGALAAETSRATAPRLPPPPPPPPRRPKPMQRCRPVAAP